MIREDLWTRECIYEDELLVKLRQEIIFERWMKARRAEIESELDGLENQPPPPIPPATPQAATQIEIHIHNNVIGHDPRDGDGWPDAVAAQGTAIPTYTDGYTLSTHWEILKDERVTGVCEMCERESATTLHHSTYRRLGNEAAQDTVAVCAGCHSKMHRGATLKRAA